MSQATTVEEVVPRRRGLRGLLNLNGRAQSRKEISQGCRAATSPGCAKQLSSGCRKGGVGPCGEDQGNFVGRLAFRTWRCR